MPRTLNPVAHAVKRDAFLDVAERLIRTKGYEQMTVQDVLDELGASKGAFYHYFDSKQALLAGVVERMADLALAVVEPIATDPDLSAAAKLQAFFATGAQWKVERSELLLGMMRSWLSEENDLVRLRVARDAYGRFTPMLAGILRQGTAEGAFDLTSADDAAAMLMALFTGSTDAVGQLLLGCLDRRTPIERFERYLVAYNEAIERILGLRAGEVVFIDTRSLHTWFD